MKKMSAVIFDMDGVIVDSEPRHEKAFLEVAKEIGFEAHGLRFADYIGRSDRDLWIDFIKKHNPSYSLDELLLMKRGRVVEILNRERPLFDGLPELVSCLAAKFPMAVASGSDRVIVDAVLKLGGLQRYFSVIVTASQVKHGKPAPDIFLRTAELLEVSPSECWVIEDSKPGIRAGLAASMKVIAITNTHSASELNGATHVVSRYSEIKSLIMKAEFR
jgi:HAD superfamily hydrolase (TIGR01509 family)